MAFAGRHPMLSLALAGLTVAIIFTEIKRLTRGYKALKPAELPLVANQADALVVDLSAIADFEKGHIAGSRNVIPSQFDPAGKLLSGKRQSPVVTVCRNGMASADAAARVVRLTRLPEEVRTVLAGFEQVHWLDGGIAAWQAAGLPLVKGR